MATSPVLVRRFADVLDEGAEIAHRAAKCMKELSTHQEKEQQLMKEVAESGINLNLIRFPSGQGGVGDPHTRKVGRARGRRRNAKAHRTTRAQGTSNIGKRSRPATKAVAQREKKGGYKLADGHVGSRRYSPEGYKAIVRARRERARREREAKLASAGSNKANLTSMPQRHGGSVKGGKAA